MPTTSLHLSPERIFIQLPSWVGDVVMCTPALRAVRRAYPDAEIVGAGRSFQAELVMGNQLNGSPILDRYLSAPGRGLGKMWAFSRELKRERFDLAIVLGESERAAVAPYLARIPVRLGYGHGALRRLLLTHHLERPRDADGRLAAFSMIERYLRVTRALGVPDAGDSMQVPVSDEARAVVQRRLTEIGLEDDKVITVVAGAAFGAAKMWPPVHFAEACDTLHEQHGWKTVFAPGPGEEALGRELARHSKHGIHVLMDPVLSLAQLAALLVRSEIALSNDTGPRSMAVALGLPVVVPVGPTDAGHTRHHLERQRVLTEEVDCRPCGLRVCPIDHRCMTQITPNKLVAAVNDLVAYIGTGPPK